MPFLNDAERRALDAVIALVQPEAVAAGAVDYIEQLLTAFEHDPPHIWLDGPWHTGDESSRWMRLGRIEEIAWRQRISQWQEIYHRELSLPTDQVSEEFRQLVFEHATEGLYSFPRYGGNRGEVGWQTAGYAGEILPRGWLPLEVSDPTGTGSLR